MSHSVTRKSLLFDSSLLRSYSENVLSEPPKPTESRERSAILVPLASQGSHEAFNELVDLHLTSLSQYLSKWFGSHHDIEDVAQDVFIKAFKSIRSLKPKAPFRSWLYGIARHTAMDALRKKYREPVFDASLSALPMEDSDLRTPNMNIECREHYQKVWNWTRVLPARQREILWLKYSEEFSVQEIAQALSLTQVHVKVLLHRARKTLATQKATLLED